MKKKDSKHIRRLKGKLIRKTRPNKELRASVEWKPVGLIQYKNIEYFRNLSE